MIKVEGSYGWNKFYFALVVKFWNFWFTARVFTDHAMDVHVYMQEVEFFIVAYCTYSVTVSLEIREFLESITVHCLSDDGTTI